MELCGDSLYIGSNEGSIIKYIFTEDKMHSATSIQRVKSRDLGPVSYAYSQLQLRSQVFGLYF